jgi:hypothetical protein
LNTRIYTVKNVTTDEVKLVVAGHPSQAIKLVVDGQYEVTAANTRDVANYLEGGGRILRATPSID